MKRYLAVFSLACGVPFFAMAEEPTTRILVRVELTGDDGLTQRLSSEIIKYIGKEPILQTASEDGEADFSIISDSNVNWDKLGRKTVVIYRVALHRGAEPVSEAVGVCLETRLSDCAKNIVTRFKGVMATHRK